MALKKNEKKLAEELSGIGVDTVKEVRKNKVLIPIILGALLAALLYLFFTTILPLIKDAKAVGKSVGKGSGQIAGLAVGSVEGATKGTYKGYSDGAEVGLSAKDTTAEIANMIKSNVGSLGKLEVLAANVDLTSFHEDGSKYAALYLLSGKAVFTVDLDDAEVSYKKERITIILPPPQSVITIDHTKTQLLKDRQAKFFRGSTDEGYQAYINSFNETENNLRDSIKNYDMLVELASQSAVKTVEEISRAIRGNTGIPVTVSIRPR